MQFKMYVIYDKVAKEGSLPFCAKNDAVAWRQFKNLVDENAKNTDEYELMSLGIYDNDPVSLDGFDRPETVYANKEEAVV